MVRNVIRAHTMNSLHSAWAADNKEYEAAFSDVAAENAALEQDPFADYDQQAGDVTAEKGVYQQSPFGY